MDVTYRIEPARERDVPLILDLIKGLAVYEKLADQVVATEDGLRESLFGAKSSRGSRDSRTAGLTSPSASRSSSTTSRPSSAGAVSISRICSCGPSGAAAAPAARC